MKNKIIVFGFIMLLASFLFAAFILEPREYSAMENRYLEQAPKFTMKSLLSGEYMEKVEEYLADQVMFKDGFVSLKADIEKLLHKKGSNGVYFGKNHRYIQVYEPDGDTLTDNINFIRNFVTASKSYAPVTFFLAPNVQSVYPEDVPSHVLMADANRDRNTVKEALSEAHFVDPTEILQEHKDEYIYFRTDHHWTMRGAYYGYQALGEELGYSVMDVEDYGVEYKSDDFLGSLYSKAPLSSVKKDSIEVFSNVLGKYRVTFEDGKHVNSLFMNSKLHTKDQYTYFLDGNHSFITIQSNAQTGKRALVFKDSYGHVLLPFLADQYEQMDVVDLRYYRGDIKSMVEGGGYSDILMIYNMDFLASDENFIWLQ